MTAYSRRSLVSRLATAGLVAAMLTAAVLFGLELRTHHSADAGGSCVLSAGVLTYDDNAAESSTIRPAINSNGTLNLAVGCASTVIADIATVVINAGDGADQITLDQVDYLDPALGFAAGFSLTINAGVGADFIDVRPDLVPLGGLFVHGDGAADTLNVRGTSDLDLYAIGPGSVRRGSAGEIVFTTIEQVDIRGGASEDVFNISNGTLEGSATALFGDQGSDQFLVSGRVASEGLLIDADFESQAVGRGNADAAIISLSNSADVVNLTATGLIVVAGSLAGGPIDFDIPTDLNARLESVTVRANSGDDSFTVAQAPPTTQFVLRGDGGNDLLSVDGDSLADQADGARVRFIGNAPLYSDFLAGTASGSGDSVIYSTGSPSGTVTLDDGTFPGNDGPTATAEVTFSDGATSTFFDAAFIQSLIVISGGPVTVNDTVPFIETSVVEDNIQTDYPGIAYVANGVVPSSGGIAGGETVRIVGTHLDSLTGVTFGGVPATFTSSSDGGLSILAVAPAATTVGPVKVQARRIDPNPARTEVANFPIDVDDTFGLSFSINSPFSPATPTDVHTYLGVGNGPTISSITGAELALSDPSFTANFTVSDAEDSTASLVPTATSNNQSVVADGNITLTPNGGGSWTITAPHSAIGAAGVTVELFDSDLNRASETFALVVGVPNQPPQIIGTFEDFEVPLGSPVPVTRFTISDPETALAELLLDVAANNGGLVPPSGLTVTPTGQPGQFDLTITPLASVVDASLITVTVTDEHGASTTREIDLTVRPVGEQIPVTAADAYSTPALTALSVAAASGVLSNDLEPDGQAMTAELVLGSTDASQGSLSLSPDGSFTFTPVATFSGFASFQYRAVDSAGSRSLATNVTILVGSAGPTIDENTLRNDGPPATLAELVMVADGAGNADADTTSTDGRSINSIAQAILANTTPTSGTAARLSINAAAVIDPATATLSLGSAEELAFTFSWTVVAGSSFSSPVGQSAILLAPGSDTDGDGFTAEEEQRLDTNPINGLSCPANLDRSPDGFVGPEDFFIFADAWQTSLGDLSFNAAADLEPALNVIDADDFFRFADFFDRTCGSQ